MYVQSAAENLIEMNAIIENLKASMLLVKGGHSFWMGDILGMYRPFFFPRINSVLVQLDDFHICNHTVTQEEWAAVMGTACQPQHAKLPKVNCSWHQVYEFIEQLNKLTNWNFRLPTEAEWEYAARGGEYSNGSIYSGRNVLDTVGWYKLNSNNQIHDVCQKESNQLGIYDMSGNVWEWCEDIYESKYQGGPTKGIFSSERYPVKNPHGGIKGNYRVIRGGSYRTKDTNCWVFYREKLKSIKSSSDLGFRLAY